MTDPETGATLFRGVRLQTLTYKGHGVPIEMPGWYPAEGEEGEGCCTLEDMKVSDQALRLLKTTVESQENMQMVGD